MHLIAGSILALGILWLWLSGHWFGRVLAFLCGVAIAFIIAAMTGVPQVAIGILVFTLPMAWAISSAPIWMARGYIIRGG